jgi:hypothetical protein
VFGTAAVWYLKKSVSRDFAILSAKQQRKRNVANKSTDDDNDIAGFDTSITGDDDGQDESIGWSTLQNDLFRRPAEAQGLSILLGIGV